MILNLAIAILLVTMVAESYIPTIPLEIAAIVMAIGLILLLLAVVYRSRFYQLEYSELIEDMVSLIARLDDAPLYVKAFYLPTVLRWKVNEYFNLV
jgi:hypothetical protein